MKKLDYHLLLKTIVIVCITIVLDILGFSFLALKLVSIPFVPNRNIDDMSDFYTAVWESVKGNSIDNGRFYVIDITENSRKEIADILATVSGMNPKVIGLDVRNIWKEDEDVDRHLVNTIQSISNIVLPVECHGIEQESPKFLYSIFKSQLQEKQYGVVSFPENRDILRTYRPSFKDGNNNIDAFSCAIARNYGADVSSVINKDKMFINYTTLRLTDEDSNEGREFLNLCKRDSINLASEVSDRIVLVGSTRLTNDQHLTPLGYSLSGIMIHAHIINTLIEDKNIVSCPVILRYLFCAIIAFVVLLLFKKRSFLKNKCNIWWTVTKYIVMFMFSMIFFAGIGTILFCRCCYYLDFAPFIVSLILVYILKDKNINFKKS